MSKTILQVIPSLISGGAELATIEIANILKNRNYIPIVVSSGGVLADDLHKAGILHIEMNVKSKNPIIILRNIKLLSDIIKKYNVNIIHARSRAPAWSCYFAAKNNKIKFITTFHGIYKKFFLKSCYNSIMVKSDAIIAVSNFVKQHIVDNYNNICHNKITVISRGVNHCYFDPANLTLKKAAKFREKYNIMNNSVPVILMPSRMSYWKGHMVLIEALHKISNKNFICLIVGELTQHIKLAKQIKKYITETQMQNKIFIFGQELDMLGLYGISDIVVSVSTEPEAFGRTIIEAQAMCKLVIASDNGGAKETVVDKINGYHFITNDSNSLAEKLAHAINISGTQRAREIGILAREHVINYYSVVSMLHSNIELYNSLLTE